MSSSPVYSIYTKSRNVNDDAAIEHLYLKLDAIFGEKNYKIIKLKGYNPRLNPERNYSFSKQPAVAWKTAPSLSQEQSSEGWVAQNGWLGLVVPQNFVVVDIDQKDTGNRIAHALKGENIEHVAISTPRGWQFIFKDTEKKITKQVTKQVTACLAVVDYRVAEQGYIVLPTPNTPNRFFAKISTDLHEIPIYFMPIRGKNFSAIPLRKGERNDSLFRHASRLYANGFSEKEVLQTIKFINKYLTDPPLPEKEIEILTKKRTNYVYSQKTEEYEDVEFVNIEEVIIEEEKGGYCKIELNGKTMLAKFKKIKNQKTKKTEYKIVETLAEFFEVVAVLRDEESKQYLRLRNPYRSTEITIFADLDKSLDLKQLTKVAGIIDPNTKREITRYIRLASFQCEVEQRVYKSVGWQQDDVFMHPGIQKNAFWLSRTDQEIPIILSEKGSMEKQVELLRLMLTKKAGIAALAAFGAPLVYITGARNFVLFFASKTKTGKTLANQVALSFFMHPEYGIKSLNTTANALEVWADTIRDLPLVMDEEQTVSRNQNSLKDIIQFIYIFTQGVGRMRATTSIRMRETAVMRGILLISGEQDLDFMAASLRGNLPAGAWNRTIMICDTDLWGDKEEKEKVAPQVYWFLREHYGILGKQYISFLQNYPKKEIKEKYRGIFKGLVKKGAGEYAGHIAVLLTALWLLRLFLKDESLGKYTEQWLWKLGPQLVAQKEKDTNILYLFMENFEGWLFENGRKVVWVNQETTQEKKDEIIAVVEQGDRETKIQITARAFSTFCNEVLKYPKKQVLDELKRKGMLETKNGKIKEFIWLKGASRRGYTIFLKNNRDPIDTDPTEAL